MKYSIFICILTFFSISYTSLSNTQTTDTTFWSNEANVSINLNQLALVNWAKGGESSIAATGLLNAKANYKKDDIQWDNVLDIRYGIMSSEQYNIRKTDDKFEIESKIGYNAFDNVFYSVDMSINSQFSDGYKYPDDSTLVSTFLSPAYLTMSTGLDYKINSSFSFFLSPFAGRFIWVADDSLSAKGVYSLEPGEKFRADFGAKFTAKAEQKIMENVIIKSKLELFNNYTDREETNRTNIDVNCESTLSMKVNDYIAANIFLHLIYDHNINVPLFEHIDGVKTKVGEGRRLQVKEVLGVGFSYKL